ncbi:ATP-binding cassette domain-containing protein [Dactylosporangium fulvum]|uniref:ATP-binding cassette domain-containing protein n=1 Tax=Dactylosporangium fulvum TaxID=53359 RepID=A0ABY5VPU3_9ACTN|nr:ATP-binding cassette domain-containing protein [Dactylosporangium fulvum]UWP79071.1 ATP-binding cassette domain-containing protein [Dactylosporangium fulvum]
MIRARKLTRHFRVKKETVEAVRGLDLDVEDGELVAFLGPNGAGKSTSLRMLTTLLPPTDGTATVAGADVRTDPAGVRQRIGYVGQGSGAGHYFRVRDELATQGRCYGLSRRASRTRADELLAVFDLEQLATRTVSTLSGGQRRRLDIAIGMVHRPRLLFLDEPSTGLDPQNRAHLAEHIRRLRRDFGTTIFLTTHYLEEADALAERVVVIDRGTVIADDTPERLKATLAGDRITVTVGSAADAGRAAGVAAGVPGAHEVTTDGAAVRIRATGGDTVVPELVLALAAAGVRTRAVDLRRPTLDDVFLTLTGRSLREGA